MSSLRTLCRGLDVLRTLNGQHDASMDQIVLATRISRGAVHRVLSTLVATGYARYVSSRYFVERKAYSLAANLEEAKWINAAQEIIEDLCRRTKWPVLVSKPNGLAMEVCGAAEELAPLRQGLVPLGMRTPMLSSASGSAFIAFQPDQVRELYLRALASESEFPEDRELGAAPERATQILKDIRAAGYAKAPAHRTTVIAVPIVSKDARVLGALSVRHFTASVSSSEVTKLHLASLQRAAADIAKNV